MFADFKFISFWWSSIFLFGLVSLPLTVRIFKPFFDRGYIFSKILSLALVTYVLFVLSVFKLLPFTQTSIALILFCFLIADFFLLRNSGKLAQFKSDLARRWPLFLLEEILFFLILTAWSYVRGFSPDIEGLEKYMDWGFVNSMLRTTYMPPKDMWFTPEAINYYYFGHLIFALLTKFSGISSAITYNLSIATVCALTFVSAFSFTGNLVAVISKKIKIREIIIGGLLSAFLLTFGGNFHHVYKIAKINMENNNGRLVLSHSAITKAASTYWYPDATRFIGFDPDIQDKTIHEFPLYSFVVADLHGHMNDIPMVVFFMAFLLAAYLSLRTKKLIDWYLVVPAGLILSLNYMSNAWDFAVYGLLFAVSFFLIHLRQLDFISLLKKTISNGFLIIFFWYLFTLPYSLNFTPMAEGLRLSDSHTPFYQLFILYGGFWLITMPFLIAVIFKFFRKKELLLPDAFAAAMVLTATLLVILPEIGYIKDIYIYEHRRANTMFKLVYEAFIMYSLLGGYAFFRFKNRLYRFLIVLVFSIHLIYPYFAIKSYYNNLETYRGLWGLKYLQDSYPDNFAAINWINQNISGQPVMLEAVGDSYTTYNQVSVATGLPTIEGWVVHEWLWRGGYDQPGARSTEVQKIYESEDLTEVRSLLQKYNVRYIFVGNKEYEKYPALDPKRFEKIGAKVIFESGKTQIYQL